jgi:hypothetical protein
MEWNHITDHDLERYYLGLVRDESELAALEEHILACGSCPARADAVQDYVDAMRGAALDFLDLYEDRHQKGDSGAGKRSREATSPSSGLRNRRLIPFCLPGKKPPCSERDHLFEAFSQATERWRLLTTERATLESTTGLTAKEVDELITQMAESRDAAFSALVEHSTKHGCGRS